MSEPSNDELDRLLSRGTLGSAQKQRMLDHIQASVGASARPRFRPRWRWPAFAALSLSGALAAALLWARPATQSESGLREKGGSAAAPILAISCLGGSLGACPTGSRIAFWVEGDRKVPGVVTAYADPVAGGERVWYLTNQPVPRAALVGPEQPSGRYRVNVILTPQSVARAELARLAPDAIVTRATFELVITP